jgi:hypothetical protein
VTTAVNNSTVHIANVHAGGDNPASYADHNDLDIGENVNALPGGDTRAKGSLTYVSPSGSVVDASYLAEEQANGLVSVNDSFVVGKATQSG